MTLRFYDGGSFKILAAKPLVNWFFLLACLVFRALLLLPFAVDMDSYLVLAATNLTSTSMTLSTWAPTTGPPQCIPEDKDHLDSVVFPRDTVNNNCNETQRTCLEFCSWRTLGNVNQHRDGLDFSNGACTPHLEELIQDILQMYEEYVHILQRFDCYITYSMWNCTRCKEAYKDWLCATKLPYYTDKGERVKPCLSYCRWTNRMCPYLLPHKPYCGQQAFLCPASRDLTANATYALPHDTCLDCEHENSTGPCVREKLVTTSHGGSIHSIPPITVYLIGCVVSLFLARTLCFHCFT